MNSSEHFFKYSSCTSFVIYSRHSSVSCSTGNRQLIILKFTLRITAGVSSASFLQISIRMPVNAWISIPIPWEVPSWDSFIFTFRDTFMKPFINYFTQSSRSISSGALESFEIAIGVWTGGPGGMITISMILMWKNIFWINLHDSHYSQKKNLYWLRFFLFCTTIVGKPRLSYIETLCCCIR